MPHSKILRLITRMNVGGPALHVLVLSEGLEARGYETVLVAGSCEDGEGDLPLDIPPDRPIVTIEKLKRSISPLRDLAAIWKMYRLIRRERPAIVHTHTAKAGLVGRIAACAARVPIVVHTFHGNSMSGYFPPRASALLRGIERLLARFTDCICVVSAQQLEEIAGTFGVAPRAKFCVIPLGLDLTNELQRPIPEQAHAELLVGWLGRLVEIKGVPLLAAVIDEAARRELPVKFLVAGDGPERRLLQDAVSHHGPRRVQWEGWQRDAGAFIGQCDILIQTSRNEGTPVALIQGMASARPFISTAAGGVVDLVGGPVLSDACGCRWHSNGVLAPDSPSSFAGALEHLVRNRALVSQMGSAARRFAAEHFQAKRLVDDMDKLYRRLTEERSAVAARDAALRNLTGELG